MLAGNRYREEGLGVRCHTSHSKAAEHPAAHKTQVIGPLGGGMEHCHVTKGAVR